MQLGNDWNDGDKDKRLPAEIGLLAVKNSATKTQAWDDFGRYYQTYRGGYLEAA